MDVPWRAEAGGPAGAGAHGAESTLPHPRSLSGCTTDAKLAAVLFPLRKIFGADGAAAPAPGENSNRLGWIRAARSAPFQREPAHVSCRICRTDGRPHPGRAAKA